MEASLGQFSPQANMTRMVNPSRSYEIFRSSSLSPLPSNNTLHNDPCHHHFWPDNAEFFFFCYMILAHLSATTRMSSWYIQILPHDSGCGSRRLCRDQRVVARSLVGLDDVMLRDGNSSTGNVITEIVWRRTCDEGGEYKDAGRIQL